MARVLLVAKQLPAGGLPKVVYKEFTYLRNHGHTPKVIVYMPEVPSYFVSIVNEMSVEFVKQHASRPISSFLPSRFSEVVARYNMDFTIFNPFRIFKVIRSFRPHRIIFHEMSPAMLTHFVCQVMSIPYIVVLHDHIDQFQSDTHLKATMLGRLATRVLSRVLRRVLAKSVRVVATTTGIEKSLHLLLPSEKVTTLRYGVDDVLSMSSYKSRNLILAVSKWDINRMPERYIDVMLRIETTTEFVIAGHWDDPTQYDEFSKRAQRERMGAKLRILPDLSEQDLSMLYDDALVFIRIGQNEKGTGQGIIEAVAHGVPVVVSSELGASEIISNPQCGIIVDGLNPQDYANAINRILSDTELANRLHSNCFVKSKDFSWSTYLESLVDSLKL